MTDFLLRPKVASSSASLTMLLEENLCSKDLAPLGSPGYHALTTLPSQFLAPECTTGSCEQTCPLLQCWTHADGQGRANFRPWMPGFKSLDQVLSSKATLDLDGSMRFFFPHASVSSFVAQENSTDLRVTTRIR